MSQDLQYLVTGALLIAQHEEDIAELERKIANIRKEISEINGRKQDLVHKLIKSGALGDPGCKIYRHNDGKTYIIEFNPDRIASDRIKIVLAEELK